MKVLDFHEPSFAELEARLADALTRSRQAGSIFDDLDARRERARRARDAVREEVTAIRDQIEEKVAGMRGPEWTAGGRTRRPMEMAQ